MQTNRQTDGQTHQYHDSARPKGQGRVKTTCWLTKKSKKPKKIQNCPAKNILSDLVIKQVNPSVFMTIKTQNSDGSESGHLVKLSYQSCTI